ncbi:MAG: amidohydrolase family protein [Candidatus Tectomicrobia bacterium]|nr:amidohydrolase family protein [Candidatus Tectomicrobia bacterium]
MSSLKITNARYIVTVDRQRRIIQDGTIIVEGNRITQVGKTSELASTSVDRVIDASHMIVTPGFPNGHMHISYAHATRGLFPDDLGPQYLPNVFKLQGIMTEEEEYHTSLLAITELLSYGTTCFVDPGSTKYLDACMQAYQDSGCRIMVGAHVADKPNPVNVPVYGTSEAIAIIEQTIAHYDHKLDDRVRAWAMPFSAAFATDELLCAAKGLADQYDTMLTLHHSNSPQANEAALQAYGKTLTEHLEDLGVLGSNVVLAHALGLTDAEVDSIARSGAKVIMCPTAAVKGGSGMTRTAKLPEMLAKGIAVGLGTDAGNNSNLLETMRSMYLVAVLYKDGRQDVKLIPAETALELATIGSATALGLGDDIGSIEVGKKADLVLFDTKRPEWSTVYNPVNSLVYNADGRSVHTVIVDGRVVVENYQPLFVTDVWSLIQTVQQMGEHMLARAGVSYPPRWPMV